MVRRYVLCVMALSLAGCGDAEVDAQQNQAAGDVLVKWIDAYRADNGSYPPTLQSLVPRYLGTIAKPKRARWRYDDRGDHFFLGFTGGGEMDAVGWYDSRERYWSIDTK